jgi:hypothetical protein
LNNRQTAAEIRSGIRHAPAAGDGTASQRVFFIGLIRNRPFRGEFDATNVTLTVTDSRWLICMARERVYRLAGSSRASDAFFNPYKDLQAPCVRTILIQWRTGI